MTARETEGMINKRFVSPMEKGKHDLFCSRRPRPKGYCHDSKIGIDYHNWMSGLSGDRKLNTLSLPGTHDTMAFHGDDYVRCQSVDLRGQLDAGIRFLDIRCRHIADVFAIHHGAFFQNVYFGDVLDIVTEFLNDNPSETVFMRVKEEYKAEKTTRTFEETFKYGYWDCRQSLFWNPANSENIENPSLSEIRGKVVVFQNFKAKDVYGIDWGSPYIDIQDNYELKTNWDLYDKWTDVKDYLIEANNSKDSNRHTYINFLSGSGVFPYFVASGQSSHETNAPRLLTGRTTPGWKDSWPDFPRVGCFLDICSIAFEGTNILTAERIGRGGEYDNYVGIIVADFPGEDLIEAVISLN